jgi:hypothetical protein
MGVLWTSMSADAMLGDMNAHREMQYTVNKPLEITRGGVATVNATAQRSREAS